MASLDLKRTPFIQDIRPGILEEGYFLLKKIHLNVGKKNKPFLRIILSDKTGHLPGVFFGSEKILTEIQESVTEGDIVKVSGLLEEYHDVMQVKLLKVTKEDKKKWELSRFWKRTPKDRRELLSEIKELINSIKHGGLKKLCRFFLSDKEFISLFLDAPASRFFHHAYIGGLLEHTLEVIKIASSFARVYPNADRDLLIAGAFLHDIGKVDEYQYLQYNIEHSSERRLKGHTLLGYERITPYLNKADLDEKTRIKIEHILISHQGKKNWGAISEPKFLEAFLIHAADYTDSSQFIFSEAKTKSIKTQNSRDPEKTDYITILDKEIYLG